MDVAYWLKDDCVEVNSAVTDHEEILARLSELMDAGGNISDNNNYREIFFGEEYRLYTDTFKDKTHLGTTLRFVKGVMIIAVTCGDVKSPGISAVTIPKGIYFPSNDIANNPARLFISVAFPTDGSFGHVKFAYELEKMLADETFKDALINAKSAEEFLNLVNAKEHGTFSADNSRENLPQNITNTKRRGSSMAISLQKGQKVDLTKGNPGLKKILIGLGWDTNKYDGGFDFDLDAAAFLLNGTGKVNSDDDFVFYNNLKHKSGAVEHMGDNLTGEGEGDDEEIKIDLEKVPANVDKIDFTVTIYDAESRKQTFGQVSNAYIRVVDEMTGKEIIRYDLGEDFSVETAVVVGEIYRNKGEWKFNAIGAGWSGGLAALGKNYGVNV
ncbi:MAG: TerD family protein [Selenomonadaceae bacterium]|nr:TerD family protein [Selenomonadaceae bacterium]